MTDYLTAVGIHFRDDGWDIDYPNAFSEDDFIINDRIARAAFRMEAEHMTRAFKVLKDDENIMKWHEESQRGWR